MRRKTKAGLMLLVLAGLAGAVWLARSEKAARWLPWQKAKATAPRTAVIGKGDLEVRFKEMGELAPKVAIQVRPPVDGQVQEVFVEEGDAVKRGDRLAVIQPGNTEAEQKLYLPTEVRSPIDGVVLYRTVNPGDAVQAGGDNFMRLANLERMLAALEIGENDILKLRTGVGATVSVDALPGESFDATLTFISPGVIQEGSSGYRRGSGKKFLVRAEIAKSDPRFKPGMTARIELLLERSTGALKAPLGGVFEQMGEARAFVKTAAGIEERLLRLGKRNEEEIEVLEGLQAGETVLLEKPEDSAVTKQAARKAGK